MRAALWVASGVVLLFVGLMAFSLFASGVRVACETVADWHHRSRVFAWLLEHWPLWIAAGVIAALAPGTFGPMSSGEAVGVGVLVVGAATAGWYALRWVWRVAWRYVSRRDGSMPPAHGRDDTRQ
jgi:hypothetical protein